MLVYFVNEDRVIAKDLYMCPIYAVLLNMKRERFDVITGNTFITTNKNLAYSLTNGMKGAMCRKCDSIEEAQTICNNPKLFLRAPRDKKADRGGGLPFSYTDFYSYAYIDGSCDGKHGYYGWGGFLDKEGKRHIIKGKRKDDYSKYGSTAGEIRGAIEIFRKAEELNVKELILYYDFDGICGYLSGNFDKKNKLAAEYRDIVKEFVSKGMELILVKAVSHSGVEGNEIADFLAREALGLRTTGCLPLNFFKPKYRYRCFPAEAGGKKITKDIFNGIEVG